MNYADDASTSAERRIVPAAVATVWDVDENWMLRSMLVSRQSGRAARARMGYV